MRARVPAGKDGAVTELPCNSLSGRHAVALCARACLSMLDVKLHIQILQPQLCISLALAKLKTQIKCQYLILKLHRYYRKKPVNARKHKAAKLFGENSTEKM